MKTLKRLSRLFPALLIAAGMLPADAADNLVRNGSFEVTADGTPEAWHLEGDETVVQRLTVEPGVTSGHSARLTCDSFKRTTRDGYSMLVQRGAEGFEKNKWYRFSCWTRHDGMAAAMVTVELMADTKAVNPYSTIVLFEQIALTHDWQRTERFFQATSVPGKDAKLHFYFDFTGSLWVDDVEIVEVPPPSADYTRRIPQIGSKNLIPNGSFECGTAGWSSLGTRVSLGAGLTRLHGELQNHDAWDGDACLRVEMGPGKSPVASFNYDVIYAVQHRALAANLGWLAVEPGKPYTFSVCMKADKPDVPAQLRIRFSGLLGGALSDGVYYQTRGPSEVSEAVTIGTEWRRYKLTAVAASRYAFVAAGPDMTTQPDREVAVWIDALQLEQDEKPTTFDTREPLEIGFTTGKLGNIFDFGQTVQLTINACNRSFAPEETTLRVKATDFFERKAAGFHQDLFVPPRSSISLACPLGLEEKGYFWVTVAWESGGRDHERRIRLAVVEPYRGTDSPFGINHAPSTDSLCKILVKAGVLMAREWVMEWQRIEPNPGEFHFETADLHINRVLATGMTMAQQLPPFPSADWNTSAPPEARDIIPDYGWGVNMYAPNDLDAMRRYIRTVVEHYRDRFNVWEYLNEPIYTFHSLPNVEQVDATIPGAPGAHYTVDDVAALQKIFYEAVKSTDPNAFTIGGLGGRPDLLTEEFFASGALEYLDAFNLHVYPGKRKPECYVPQMELLLTQMDEHVAERRPIWNTEYSYYGVDQLPWEPYVRGPGGWAQNRLLRDGKECADYSVRYALIMMAHGVEKICYHCGCAMSNEVNAFGVASPLTAYGGEPRKAYAAQAALSNMLGPEPEFTAPLEKPDKVKGISTKNVYGYAFQCDGHAVLAAWAPAADPPAFAGVNDSNWVLRIPKKAQAFDIVGVRSDETSIRLGESPVYIVSKSIPAAALAKRCVLERTD